MGEIEADGDIYISGSRVGEIEDDGDIYRSGSRWGAASGCCSTNHDRHKVMAALHFFDSGFLD